MEKRIKTLKNVALTLLVCFATSPIYSQVTIGSLKVPETFSLLELVGENSRGLRLPHIETTAQRDAIFTNAEGFKTNPLALGLQIYNMQTKSVETWNGTDWVSAWLLTGNEETTPGTHFLGTLGDQDLVFKRNKVQAGWLNSSNNNTAFGVAALPTTTTGIYNSAVGYNALSANTTGNSNTAMGYNALRDNTTGDFNTAVGMKALASMSGKHNTAVGSNAMSNGTSATSSTAVGSGALQNNANYGNTAVGFEALKTNTSGDYNTAVGSAALTNSTTGGSNTAVGGSAMAGNTTGANNVAVGTKALQSNATGNDNIALGNSAGGTVKGSDNIVIGNDVNTTIDAANNELNIGNVIYGVNMYNPSPKKGSIGIGTNNPKSTLEVNGAITTVPYNAGANLTIDFSLGNVAYSAATGSPAFNFIGLKNGGTYTLAWQSNAAGTATIPTTNLGTPKMMTSPAKTASQHVVYSIVCIGDVAYVYPAVFD